MACLPTPPPSETTESPSSVGTGSLPSRVRSGTPIFQSPVPMLRDSGRSGRRRGMTTGRYSAFSSERPALGESNPFLAPVATPNPQDLQPQMSTFGRMQLGLTEPSLSWDQNQPDATPSPIGTRSGTLPETDDCSILMHQYEFRYKPLTLALSDIAINCCGLL